ncbi:hypothetical protein MJO28_001865 [Puccinia striiformis f. sp. tritici]|uniref:DM2 domain-containing protein n=2 Tax=Puccinia striiformis TaxID=27350 RepID=A0A2S4V4L4_9BASI|nr:hypothetical protein Pst134EA_002908 [Puccinia striiformis f. sp. tritici]KAH9472285.1 hypothetical protein Pst134EA_002908 [Puccinia striiformis f. sp. tritici]KAI7961376.1 hypothetical protein MJO28_001865 [Puccinia striiformis f. sp. tritici]POW04438.1 hypothetical protein PSTT_10369 [Puccinia striiformis]
MNNQRQPLTINQQQQALMQSQMIQQQQIIQQQQQQQKRNQPQTRQQQQTQQQQQQQQQQASFMQKQQQQQQQALIQQQQQQQLLLKTQQYQASLPPPASALKRPTSTHADALGPNVALTRAKRFRPTDRNLPKFEPANPKAPVYSLEGLVPSRQDGLHRISKQYEKLQKIEREFDWLISRKRFEIADTLRKPNGVPRTLRIKVWNTVENQAWQQQTSFSSAEKKTTRQTSDENPEENGDDQQEKGKEKGDRDDDDKGKENDDDEAQQPSKQTSINFNAGEGVPKWTLHIEGHLIEPNHQSLSSDHHMEGVESSDPQQQEIKIEETKRPFSSLINSLMIKIDRSNDLYPEPNIIEYHRPSTPTSTSNNNFSTITVSRNGTENCRIKVALHLNEFPRRFKLNPILGSFLDLKEASLDFIFDSIWSYIKKNNLIDSGLDKRLIRKDSNLACLFPPNVDRMPFHLISEQVRKYISVPEPVIVDYEIKVDKEDHNRAEFFDIQFSIEDPAKAHLLSIQNQLEDNSSGPTSSGSLVNPTKEIIAIDEQIMDTMAKIREVKIRRDFYQKFTLDPIGFIEDWVRSQSKDLEMLFGYDKGGEASSANYALSRKRSRSKKQDGEGDDDGLNEVDHQKRFSKFYHEQWVDDAVKIYQSREFNQQVQLNNNNSILKQAPSAPANPGQLHQMNPNNNSMAVMSNNPNLHLHHPSGLIPNTNGSPAGQQAISSNSSLHHTHLLHQQHLQQLQHQQMQLQQQQAQQHQQMQQHEFNQNIQLNSNSIHKQAPSAPTNPGR